MNSLIFFICALFFTAVWASPAGEECDKTKCKGPLKVYKDLSCEPVYKNKGDCCPHKYDCKGLKNRSVNKCHYKGHEYNIGDRLREEDAELCRVNCVCRGDPRGVARFNCANVECVNKPQPGCYLEPKSSQCCPSEVCPKTPEDWPTCEVESKTIKAGDYFRPAGEPDKQCRCGAGYKGENIEPFCQTRGSAPCGLELGRANEIHNSCAPVFSKYLSPQKDCAYEFRCQTDQDEVIKEQKSAGTEEKSDEDMVCHFGKLTMKVGEKVNQRTGESSVCVCEIPPIPTCLHL